MNKTQQIETNETLIPEKGHSLNGLIQLGEGVNRLMEYQGRTYCSSFFEKSSDVTLINDPCLNVNHWPMMSLVSPLEVEICEPVSKGIINN